MKTAQIFGIAQLDRVGFSVPWPYPCAKPHCFPIAHLLAMSTFSHSIQHSISVLISHIWTIFFAVTTKLKVDSIVCVDKCCNVHIETENNSDQNNSRVIFPTIQFSNVKKEVCSSRRSIVTVIVDKVYCIAIQKFLLLFCSFLVCEQLLKGIVYPLTAKVQNVLKLVQFTKRNALLSSVARSSYFRLQAPIHYISLQYYIQ